MSSATVSPARKQYLEIKKQFPDAILMYQVGDFYETFDEDAYIASRELQIVRTTRSQILALMDLLGVSNVPAQMRIYDARPWEAVHLLLTAL